MKKLLTITLFILNTTLAFSQSQSPTSNINYDIDATHLTQNAINIAGRGIGAHIFTWSIQKGILTSCTLAFQTSFSSAGPWTTQATGDCTIGGTSNYLVYATNFFRVNATTFIQQVGISNSVVTVNYAGYIIAPTNIATITTTGNLNGLQNINNERFSTNFTGSSNSVKIAAALADLPSTGGIIYDTSEGNQNWTTCPFTGIVKQVTLVISTSVNTLSVDCTVPSNISIEFGKNAKLSVNSGKVLTWNGLATGTPELHVTGLGTVVGTTSGGLQAHLAVFGAASSLSSSSGNVQGSLSIWNHALDGTDYEIFRLETLNEPTGSGPYTPNTSTGLFRTLHRNGNSSGTIADQIGIVTDGQTLSFGGVSGDGNTIPGSFILKNNSGVFWSSAIDVDVSGSNCEGLQTGKYIYTCPTYLAILGIGLGADSWIQIADNSSLANAAGVEIKPNGPVAIQSNLRLSSSASYGWSDGGAKTGVLDTSLFRFSSGIIFQHNSTNAQTFGIASTYTSDTNFEWLRMSGNSGGAFTFLTDKVGAGTVRGLNVGTNGGNADLAFITNGSNRWTITGSSGTLSASTDGNVDIGSNASGRPNNIYIKNSISLAEVVSCPVGATDRVILCAKDSGGGKTVLYAQFPTGSLVQLGIEP